MVTINQTVKTMKNADKPAYPTMKVDRIEGEVANWQEGGLTKREAFAMAAMQGIMSSLSAEVSQALGAAGSTNGLSHVEVISDIAVEQADALLKEIERTKG